MPNLLTHLAWLGLLHWRKIERDKDRVRRRILACQTFERQIKCLTKNVCTLFAVILLFDLSFMITIESVHALDVWTRTIHMPGQAGGGGRGDLRSSSWSCSRQRGRWWVERGAGEWPSRWRWRSDGQGIESWIWCQPKPVACIPQFLTTTCGKKHNNNNNSNEKLRTEKKTKEKRSGSSVMLPLPLFLLLLHALIYSSCAACDQCEECWTTTTITRIAVDFIFLFL